MRSHCVLGGACLVSLHPTETSIVRGFRRCMHREGFQALAVGSVVLLELHGECSTYCTCMCPEQC